MKNRIQACGLSLLVSILAAPAFAEETAVCSANRSLAHRENGTFYLVGDRASTLYMISRDLYGDENEWERIARWNDLKPPYILRHGQLLAIRGEPRLDEEAGTRALISAWTELARKGKYPESSKARITALEACLPPKKIETVAVTPIPSPTPSPSPVAFVAPLPPPRPDAIPEPAPITEVAGRSEAVEPEEGHHSHWGFSVALTSSLFSLESEDEEHEVHNKLYSKLNYGAELGLERHLSEKWGLGIGAGIERISIEPAEGAVIENADRNLAKFTLELEYEVAEPFAVSLGGAYVQRPISEGTSSGTSIDAIYLPELSLGAHLRFFEKGPTRGWIVGEGAYAFATEDQGRKFKADLGYSAGLRFEYRLRHSTLNLSPMYRMLKVGTATEENKQEAFLLQLGWNW